MGYKLMIIVLCVTAFMNENQAQDNKYTTKYDDMNIDDILKSERLLNNYVKCLMEQGPCTPDGSELKRVLKDALETDCEKCSEKQKKSSEKVIYFLMKNKPEVWKKLESKYDPDGTYQKKYADRIPQN